MPYSEQITAATNIRTVFLKKELRYAMLIARCQAGKTGAFQELIRQMLLNGDINRAYILCGSNETELRDQAHADTLAANPAAYASGDIKVLFRQNFKGGEMDITRSLIVVDESHMDQTQKQELDKFLGSHGLSLDANPKTLNEKDAYMVSVDATPYSELSALMYKESHPKHVEQLMPGAGYFGIADYYYGGLMKPTFDISSAEAAFTNMVRCAGKKYGLMRLISGKHAKNQEDVASKVYENLGGRVLYFTAEKTDIEISALKGAPAVPTLIIVRGRLRAGKVVPKENISFVWEGAKTSKTDALVQGLVGRMCGYEFGAEKPLIFVPQSALTRNEGKVVKASEIQRAIMDYPLALPTKGTNLKKGHIANCAPNGKTQCPPLRLTWDAEGGWTPPTMQDSEVGKYCQAFLLAHEGLLDDAPFSVEQKEEIKGFIATANPHTWTLRRVHTSGPHKGQPMSEPFKKYFGEVIAACESKTAVAENVEPYPQVSFFITKDAILPNSNKNHLYVIFYTTATNGAAPGMMATDLKSRIAQTNGKSVFSVHDQQVDHPLVAGGVVGFDESKIKTPALLESALRDYLRLYRESNLTVARCIQSNKQRFSLIKNTFHYLGPKQNDVEAICIRLGGEFSVKIKVTYTRSGADSFNVKKIEW